MRLRERIRIRLRIRRIYEPARRVGRRRLDDAHPIWPGPRMDMDNGRRGEPDLDVGFVLVIRP